VVFANPATGRGMSIGLVHAGALTEPGLAQRILALGAGAPRYPTPGRSRRGLLEILR
jgi:hypothetical protein